MAIIIILELLIYVFEIVDYFEFEELLFMKLECFRRVKMMMAVNLEKMVIDFDLKFTLPIYSSKCFIVKLILNSHFDRYFH
jgi:hypothetical protein